MFFSVFSKSSPWSACQFPPEWTGFPKKESHFNCGRIRLHSLLPPILLSFNLPILWCPRLHTILCWNFVTIWGARNRVGIRLSYRPAMLHWLGILESIIYRLSTPVLSFFNRSILQTYNPPVSQPSSPRVLKSIGSSHKLKLPKPILKFSC